LLIEAYRAATAAKKLTDQEKQVYEIGKAQNDGVRLSVVLSEEAIPTKL